MKCPHCKGEMTSVEFRGNCWQECQIDSNGKITDYGIIGQEFDESPVCMLCGGSIGAELITDGNCTVDSFTGKEIKTIKVFDSSAESFDNIDAAAGFLENEGYIVGSLCMSEPIGFVKKDKGIGRIAKWWNLSAEDKTKLDGIITSEDMKNGKVIVAFFND